MYAIFRTAGKQFRAEKGKTLRLPRLAAEPGATLTFDEVLLSSDGQTVRAGTPLIKGASVTAEVVAEGKEPRSTCSSSSGGRTIAARPDTGSISPRSG